ncbi:hypothetical protein FPY71_17155 [Aureimonas fodinaquatilis]|uniref:Plastocyanin-like domain-containing protein n=1 Tax=Aureimonas fodinaquatilis TaxID=2565783 RepID=A0A5B0DRN5_9HYPH|nr:hypothetical protein FPY71_17155 [Aureimonas fodinaquatilis]
MALSPAGVAYAQGTTAPAGETQADDDDDDDDDGEAAAPAATGAGNAQMPASAMSADALGLAPLSRSSQDVPELVLGSADNDFAVNETDFVMRVGQAYRWRITSDGALEYKFHAPNFFRNIWFNQIVISDLELHMAGPPAWLEYDAKGTIQVQFNTVRPGNFDWWIEGLDGSQGMKGTITVVP